jgi:N-acetylmuramoyl-L-alanine amidase
VPGKRRNRRIRIATGVAVCALALLALPGASEPRPDRFDTVVIDPGHGGENHGARGAGGLLEKDLVLDVSLRLARRLEERGVGVVLTRSDDRFVSLEERTSIANDARGDLFVSIHANASRSRSARGIETFFVSMEASDEAAQQIANLENQAFAGSEAVARISEDPLLGILGDLIATEHLVESQEFARLVERRLASDRSRGVKQAPFVVLMGVQMPAALVEIGFLTNPAEERGLRTSAERDRLAEGMAGAVVEFGERYDARRGAAAPPADRDDSGAAAQ